jgi:hypothetical protein
MGAERVSWGWNSSALFPKYKCVENWDMKLALRLALVVHINEFQLWCRIVVHIRPGLSGALKTGKALTLVLWIWFSSRSYPCLPKNVLLCPVEVKVCHSGLTISICVYFWELRRRQEIHLNINSCPIEDRRDSIVKATNCDKVRVEIKYVYDSWAVG